MQKLIAGSMLGVVLMTGAAAPALAGDRDHASRGEVRRDRQDVREERREYRDALRRGDRRDIREERREYRDAKRELREDRRDLRRDRREVRRDDWRTYRNYDYNRYDPRYGNYYADRYYRDGSYYQPRRLTYNDRIYRGQDGRYYCRRDDGTTGLIVGALGGGVLGNVIAPGGSKTLGTILGAVGGGLLGRTIDRNGATCR